MNAILKKDKAVLTLAILAFAVFAAIFIYNTSFVIDDVRYFSLFDDAMISMNYARNLAGGEGLVMNPGERVEGFRSPLWTISMAMLHKLPVAIPNISLIVQIIGALLLIANLFIVRMIALSVSKKASHVASAAIILTAFCLPLINWTLQGLETGLTVVLLNTAVLLALKAVGKHRVPLSAYIILGITTFVRLEMAMIFACVMLFFVLTDGVNRRKHLLSGGLIFAGFLAFQTVCRLIYYGDPLPNSYYLTMTGYPGLLRIIRGFLVWGDFIGGTNVILFAIPAIGLFVWPSKKRSLLATVIGTQMLISIVAGGDNWEELRAANRYIAVIMPLFAVLLADSLSRIVKAINKAVAASKLSRNVVTKRLSGNAFGILIILAFFSLNAGKDPLSIKGLLMLAEPLNVAQNREGVERAMLIKRITAPNASVAVAQPGVMSYFSERPTVDLLGTTDSVIARQEMRRAKGLSSFRHFLPVQRKYNYAHSVGTLKPDAILQLWGNTSESDPFIVDQYTKLAVGEKFYYLRNGSERVLWSKFMGQK